MSPPKMTRKQALINQDRNQRRVKKKLQKRTTNVVGDVDVSRYINSSKYDKLLSLVTLSKQEANLVRSNNYVNRRKPQPMMLPYYPNKRDIGWLSTKEQDASSSITLADELNSFAEYVSLDQAEEDSRRSLVQTIEEIVQSRFPTAKINQFGSYKVGLSIFLSDIDLSVDGIVAAEFQKKTEIEQFSDCEEVLVPLSKRSRIGEYVSVTEECSKSKQNQEIEDGEVTWSLDYTSSDGPKGENIPNNKTENVIEISETKEDVKEILTNVDASAEIQVTAVSLSKELEKKSEEVKPDLINPTSPVENNDKDNEHSIVDTSQKRESSITSTTLKETISDLSKTNDINNKNTMDMEKRIEVGKKRKLRVDDFDDDASDTSGGSFDDPFSDSGSEDYRSPLPGERSPVEEDLDVQYIGRDDSLVNPGPEHFRNSRVVTLDGGRGNGFVSFPSTSSGTRKTPEEVARRHAQLVNLKEIHLMLRKLWCLEKLELRSHARVPIINLVHKNGVECDINVEMSQQLTSMLVGKLYAVCGPAFFILSAFFKIFLALFDLDKPFTGGLGSYKLYVMIARLILNYTGFVQRRPENQPAVGLLFVMFLDFYGNERNFNEAATFQVLGADVSFERVSKVPYIQELFQISAETLLSRFSERIRAELASLSPAENQEQRRQEAYLVELLNSYAPDESYPGEVRKRKLSSSALGCLLDARELSNLRLQHRELCDVYPPLDDGRRTQAVLDTVLEHGQMGPVSLEQIERENPFLSSILRSFANIDQVLQFMRRVRKFSNYSNERFKNNSGFNMKKSQFTPSERKLLNGIVSDQEKKVVGSSNSRQVIDLTGTALKEKNGKKKGEKIKLKKKKKGKEEVVQQVSLHAQERRLKSRVIEENNKDNQKTGKKRKLNDNNEGNKKQKNDRGESIDKDNGVDAIQGLSKNEKRRLRKLMKEPTRIVKDDFCAGVTTVPMEQERRKKKRTNQHQ